MTTGSRGFIKRFSIRTVACLALLLLSASVLSASHVHDLDNGPGQSYFEHCAAYHIADHQQSATTEAHSIASFVDTCHPAAEAQTTISRKFYLPHSRAPPFFS